MNQNQLEVYLQSVTMKRINLQKFVKKICLSTNFICMCHALKEQQTSQLHLWPFLKQ